jgi:hypothetical protein
MRTSGAMAAAAARRGSAGGVGVGVEEHLVRAEEVLLRRPFDRLLDRHVVGPEGVVVEEEERRQDRPRPFARPLGVGVLRRQGAELAADGHLALILLDAARLAGVRRHGPQVVVARHPEEAREAALEDGEGEAEVLLGLADVAGDDQPVVGVRAQRLEGPPRPLVAQVEVGDRIELHSVGWRIS